MVSLTESSHAGELVGEALLRSYVAASPQVREQIALVQCRTSQAGPINKILTGCSSRTSKDAEMPFVRPMTPTHRARTAGAAASGSPLTMHTKAKKAAQSMNSIASGTGNADEYIEAFGPRRELPRTPKLHSGR